MFKNRVLNVILILILAMMACETELTVGSSTPSAPVSLPSACVVTPAPGDCKFPSTIITEDIGGNQKMELFVNTLPAEAMIWKFTNNSGSISLPQDAPLYGKLTEVGADAISRTVGLVTAATWLLSQSGSDVVELAIPMDSAILYLDANATAAASFGGLTLYTTQLALQNPSGLALISAGDTYWNQIPLNSRSDTLATTMAGYVVDESGSVKSFLVVNSATGNRYSPLTSDQISVLSMSEPLVDLAEMNLALANYSPLGKVMIANTAGEEISAEQYKAAAAGNPCPPLIDGKVCHALTDGEKAKIASRIQAAAESAGKSVAQCLARVAAEGTSNAVLLVMEASFHGASGSLYKGVSFIHNVDFPDRSTFMSLRRLKDGPMPGFTEIPKDDPRCAAALEFMGIMREVLTAYQ